MYNIVGIYKFKIYVDEFYKYLNDILFYVNRKYFMIIVYIFNGKEMNVYIEFYYKYGKCV